MPDTAAPLATTDYGLASAAVQMALALVVILAVILAAYWVLRRVGPKFGLGPGGRGGMLRLVAHLALGPRKSIIVVRFLNKDLVLGVTDHSITLLTEGETAHEPPKDFAATLSKTVKNGGEPSP